MRALATGASAPPRAKAGRRSRKAAPAPAKKRQRDPLLSAICHDLRAPLAAVTMGANFVLQTTEDDELHARSRRILEAMLRSCAQMERLIRNFADLSEIEGGAVELRLGQHDTGEMLEIAAQGANDAAVARAIVLEVHKPAPNVVLRCDRERILRALAQLVDNAIKSAPEGSVIRLALADHGDDVELVVTDRGPGISAQVRRNLFDRQWHAKRASRVGAGLGLAIVRGFAVAHGGRVNVDSRPEATSVGIVLPRGVGSAPAAARRPAKRQTA